MAIYQWRVEAAGSCQEKVKTVFPHLSDHLLFGVFEITLQ